jgi:hypothetical protein
LVGFLPVAGVPLVVGFFAAGFAVAGLAAGAAFLAEGIADGFGAAPVLVGAAFDSAVAITTTTPWHTGHLIFLPAKWSFTLSVFWQLSHLTRIGMTGFLLGSTFGA